MLRAHHRQLHRGAGLPVQEHPRLLDRHLPGGKPGNGFQDVTRAQVGFGGRAVREHGDHADPALALGEHQANLSALPGPLLVILVLAGAQVARVRVQLGEQPVQGADGNPVEVRRLHVVVLDAVQHLAEDRQLLIGALADSAPQQAAGHHIADHQQGSRQGYGAHLAHCHLRIRPPVFAALFGGKSRVGALFSLSRRCWASCSL